jgi:hypothetical protein
MHTTGLGLQLKPFSLHCERDKKTNDTSTIRQIRPTDIKQNIYFVLFWFFLIFDFWLAATAAAWQVSWFYFFVFLFHVILRFVRLTSYDTVLKEEGEVTSDVMKGETISWLTAADDSRMFFFAGLQAMSF